MIVVLDLIACLLNLMLPPRMAVFPAVHEIVIGLIGIGIYYARGLDL